MFMNAKLFFVEMLGAPELSCICYSNLPFVNIFLSENVKWHLKIQYV